MVLFTLLPSIRCQERNAKKMLFKTCVSTRLSVNLGDDSPCNPRRMLEKFKDVIMPEEKRTTKTCYRDNEMSPSKDQGMCSQNLN